MSAANNQLLLISSCYSAPPTDYSFLEMSCRNVGITLHPYGVGDAWPGFTKRLQGAVDYIKNRSEDIVMFLDSADTFVLDPAEVIVEKFKSNGGGFLFSSEKNCWPDSTLAHYTPYSYPPWKYLNAGGWIARRDTAVDFLTQVLAKYGAIYPEDDTRCFVQWWLDEPMDYCLDIDNTCDIFQSMYMHVDGEIDWTTFRNTVTNTTPSSFHFNGRAPGREMVYARAISAGRVKLCTT
jgi:hypothetical protein